DRFLQLLDLVVGEVLAERLATFGRDRVGLERGLEAFAPREPGELQDRRPAVARRRDEVLVPELEPAVLAHAFAGQVERVHQDPPLEPGERDQRPVVLAPELVELRREIAEAPARYPE